MRLPEMTFSCILSRMTQRLMLSALVVGAAALSAGCPSSDDTQLTPDAATPDAMLDAASGFGDARVTWNLRSADQNGNPVPAGCPAGADSAIVYSLPEGAPPQDAFLDKFDCADLAGTAAILPVGRYLIWVRLTSFDESVLYAESGSLVADIVGGGVTPVSHDIFVDHAFYMVDWTLSPSGGGQVPCASVVGEDGVSIIASHSGGSFIDTVVDCEVGQGGSVAVTDPLPSSLTGEQYTIAISLLDAQQQSIGDAAPIAASPARALDYGNKFVDLGTVDIALR